MVKKIRSNKIHKLARAILYCGAAGLLTSCMSTTVVFDPAWERKAKPVYVDYYDTYLIGFVGHNAVNLTQVCMDQKPLALRRIKSLEDGFLTLITAGIYSPITIKIWCGD